jgi:hypothetical protein
MTYKDFAKGERIFTDGEQLYCFHEYSTSIEFPELDRELGLFRWDGLEWELAEPDKHFFTDDFDLYTGPVRFTGW